MRKRSVYSTAFVYFFALFYKYFKFNYFIYNESVTSRVEDCVKWGRGFLFTFIFPLYTHYFVLSAYIIFKLK